MKKLLTAIALMIAAFLPVAARAEEPESVRVAIGGRALITYLPFTLAEQLGYFKDAGIVVSISDFQGGSQSVEALVGGSADMAIGAYEHTLVLQAKGIALETVALLNDSYGAVIALKPALAKTYKAPADLKGLKFGVTAPGSSSALALELLLAKGDLPITAVSVIGIGAGPGAIAAGKAGQLDGVSQFDPVITPLVRDGDVVPIVDIRTADGMKYLYGGPIAGSSVLTTVAFAASHEDVAKAVPATYYGADRALYMQEIDLNRASFSHDGIVPRDAAANTLKVLTTYGPLKGKSVAIDKSYDNSFVSVH